MWVTVCSERSSCPCLCSGVDEKSVSRPVGSWNFQGAFPVKEKYRPCSIAMDFVGWNSGKMNRVCCGAVNSSWTFPHGSGGSHGDNQPLSVAVFKMNTTTSCGWIWTNPQNQGIYKKNTTVCRMRQEGFEKFIEVKQEKYDTSCSFRKKYAMWIRTNPIFCLR